MTFILISGRTNTGKTQVCKRLHNLIVQNPSFTFCHCPLPTSILRVDLIECFENSGKQIMLNYASDNNNCMERLAEYLDSLTQCDVRPDIFITTIRETNKYNYQMSRMLALLDAIAADTPNLERHFTRNIANVTSFAPSALRHHAFVLHLEKQSNTKNVALNRYWNNNASKVYDMLDFALARL